MRVLTQLTQPTRGRIALWSVLSFLWFLFLPQDLAMWMTWRNHRASRR